MSVKTKLLSSLEKVFLDKTPESQEYTHGSCLLDEEFSFQLAYFSDNELLPAHIEVISDINEYISLYRIENVPSEMPVVPDSDDGFYLRRTPGLYPDVLYPIEDNTVFIYQNMWKALWVSVRLPNGTKAGTYTIKVRLTSKAEYTTNEKSGVNIEKTFTLKVIDAVLPKQKTIFTQWFHADCIADYYNVPSFSEEHWTLVESFMKMASEHGITMILTPIFTPPLDTAVGWERTTVQLVDVSLDNGKYTFGFDKLERWIKLAKKCGISKFEMSHLFTQWGGEHAPKIIATVDGEEKKLFGWETDSIGEQYTYFLKTFLPSLSAFLKKMGVAKDTIFHVSDEPMSNHIEHYSKIRKIVGDALNEEYTIMDALSSYEYYERGIVKAPIPSTDHIKPFIENNVPHLWAYYCGGQHVEVANRYMSMPAVRNRVIGIQFYKFSIEGFLHWGYNFYNSRCSWFKIDPFRVTDAACSFPSGGSFSVYPGKDGALPSTRLKVFYNALCDVRALELLETLMPREDIIKKLDEVTEIRFDNYPHSAEWLLSLREWINEKIEMLK